MAKVISLDGTIIGFSRAGDGPPLILVDGALCYRGSGPMSALAEELSPYFRVFTYDRRGRGESGNNGLYAVEREVEDIAALIKEAGGSASLFGISSGAALALAAANSGLSIERVAVYEAPFIVDDTRPPVTDEYMNELRAMLAADRRADAVRHFMKAVGVPAFFITLMRFMPAWSKLKAIAPTLLHDFALTNENQQGKPLSPRQWSSIAVPVLAIVGGKSPDWMKNGMRALAGAVPNATLQTLPGQTHMVSARALAPMLKEFFTAPAPVRSGFPAARSA
jgi:pimeloyl-ACP methyl ester carboxylesterase